MPVYNFLEVRADFTSKLDRYDVQVTMHRDKFLQ